MWQTEGSLVAEEHLPRGRHGHDAQIDVALRLQDLRLPPKHPQRKQGDAQRTEGSILGHTQGVHREKAHLSTLESLLTVVVHILPGTPEQAVTSRRWCTKCLVYQSKQIHQVWG